MVTEEYSCKQVADMFGVSVNEVRKWTHYFNVKKVGNSYKWSKKQADDFYKTTIAPIIIIRSETKKLEHEIQRKEDRIVQLQKKADERTEKSTKYYERMCGDPTGVTYSCYEIANSSGYSVAEVRRWASGHNVYFNGNSYVWTQDDLSHFSEDTRNGRNKKIFTTQKKINENEYNRNINLYNRYSEISNSNNQITNENREYQQTYRQNLTYYYENKSSNNKGCLITALIFGLLFFMVMCSIL